MFEGCSALTAVSRVPVPAAGTDTRIMVNMFSGCSSLAQLSVDFKVWPSNTTDWLNGVSANGTFYCYDDLGTDQTISRGASYCPTGWNVVNLEKVKYLQWVETQGNPMALGVTADNDLCCHTILSGTANGGYFIVNMPDDQFSDDQDWRFFNVGSQYFYMDVGTARASGTGWNSSGWNDVQTWNCGFRLNGYSSSTSPGTGVYEAELSIKNANSVKFRELQFWKGAEILADLKPAIDANGVVGFWDVVNEQFRAPEGAWLSGPLSSEDITILSGLTVQDGQYFDTGYKPNQDTRVVMSVDVQHSLEYWFGCWDVAYNNGAFAMGNDNSNVYVGYDGQGGGQGSSPVANGTH